MGGAGGLLSSLWSGDGGKGAGCEHAWQVNEGNGRMRDSEKNNGPWC